MKRLGFINTEQIKFNSWCETGDRSAVVPHSVSYLHYTSYLSPLQPGKFIISYGSIGSKTLYLPNEYSAKDSELALNDIITAVNGFKEKFSSLYRKENPHYSNDFKWSDQNKTWLFKGMPVKLIQFTLADDTKGFFLNF